MSTKPNDGGPAFPCTIETECDFPGMKGRKYPLDVPGMSLRDWFAGQIAAAGIINAKGVGGLDEKGRADLFKAHAGTSYELADALLAAREKGTK